MNTRQRFLVAGGLVFLSAVASLLAVPSLPEQVVTHWNAAGAPDGTMGRTAALALLPALSATLVGLFWILPRIGPLGENVEEFRAYFDWFVVIFTAYLLLLHLGILAFNLGYRFDVTALVLVGVAALLYYLGVLLTHARRNWFVGIRTPWTLSDDEVWDRTHALGGRLFELTALLALVGLAFGEYAIYFLLVPLLVVAAVAVTYSYVLYERLDDPTTSPDGGSGRR